MSSGKEQIQGLLEAGLRALDAGDLHAALDKWNSVLRIDPQNERAARLVRDLEGIVYDHAQTQHGTPAGGTPQVVVDVAPPALPRVITPGGDPKVSASGELRPASGTSIARQTVDRLQRIIDDSQTEGQRLALELQSTKRELMARADDLSRRERELLEIRDLLSQREARLIEVDDQRRTLQQAVALSEREKVDLNLRLEERKGFERKTLERLREVDSRARELEAALASETSLRAAEEATTAALRHALSDSERTLQRLTEELEAARGESGRARLETDQVRARSAEVESQLLRETQYRTEISAALDAARASQQSTEAALAEHKAHAESLANELAEAADQLDQASRGLGAATAERDALAARVAALDQQLAEREQRLAALTAQIEDSERLLARLREELSGERAARLDGQQRAESLAAELAEEQARIAQLCAEADTQAESLAALQAMHDEVNREAQRLRRDTGDLAAQLSQAIADRDAARSEVIEIRAQLSELKTDQHSAVDALARLTNALQKAQVEVRRLEEAATEHAGSLSAERSRREQAETRIAGLETRLSESSQLVAGLEAQLSAAAAAAAERFEELESLRSREPGASPEQVRALEDRIDALEGGVEARDAQLESLRTSLAEAHTATEHSEQELAEALARLASQSRSGTHHGVDRGYDQTPLPPQGAEDSAFDIRNMQNLEADPDVLELEIEVEGIEPPAVPESAPPPIPVLEAVDEEPEAPEHDATPVPDPAREQVTRPDLSAIQVERGRLADRSVPGKERLSWLIDETPRRTAELDRGISVNAQEGYLIDMIDGTVTFADVLDMVGRNPDDTADVLCGLLLRGLITCPSLDR
jgi:chromosome segregation ATPase